MEYCEGKKFNLKNQRPKVLLFGNGFFYNDCDWEKFLKDSKKDDVDNSFFELKNLPYSIKADSGIDTDDKRRREKYKAALKEIPCSNSNPLVKKLLHIQFDAILTTNYTYQLEQHIDNTYKSCSEQRKRSKYAKTTINRNEKSAKLEKQDAKILLHIYNHLDTSIVIRKSIPTFRTMLILIEYIHKRNGMEFPLQFFETYFMLVSFCVIILTMAAQKGNRYVKILNL